LHVDAAYGWSALLTEDGKRALAGIELADSVVLDPHKWFAQTYEAGCVLVRDGAQLPGSFALRPDYMQDVEPEHDEINFADHGIALTRRFRALKVWLSIQALGLGWFRRLVAHCCRLADFAQALLERAGFEIVSTRQLSIVCFRRVPARMTAPDDVDAFNLALVAELMLTGQAFLSSTRLDGRVALRMCFVNARTTAADVELVVELLKVLAERLEKQL
jgi:glutamate/tyrosine decarboxylase-like PLP-dependent enzyme